MGKSVLLEVRQGAQISQIGAEDNGEDCLVITGNVVAVGTLEDVDFGETLMGGLPLVQWRIF